MEKKKQEEIEKDRLEKEMKLIEEREEKEMMATDEKGQEEAEAKNQIVGEDKERKTNEEEEDEDDDEEIPIYEEDKSTGNKEGDKKDDGDEDHSQGAGSHSGAEGGQQSHEPEMEKGPTKRKASAPHPSEKAPKEAKTDDDPLPVLPFFIDKKKLRPILTTCTPTEKNLIEYVFDDKRDRRELIIRCKWIKATRLELRHLFPTAFISNTVINLVCIRVTVENPHLWCIPTYLQGMDFKKLKEDGSIGPGISYLPCVYPVNPNYFPDDPAKCKKVKKLSSILLYNWKKDSRRRRFSNMQKWTMTLESHPQQANKVDSGMHVIKTMIEIDSSKWESLENYKNMNSVSRPNACMFNRLGIQRTQR